MKINLTKHIRIQTIFLYAGLLLSLARPAAVHALTFNFTFLNPGQTAANNAFIVAGNFWASQFSDPVTVNIDAGFAALPSGVLASAGSARLFRGYDDLANGLAADATTAADATFVAGLPTGTTPSPNSNAPYQIYVNETAENPHSNSATPYLATRDEFSLTRANAKAMGLIAGVDTTTDASITFSSLFSWDFDPNDMNGVGAGLQDFVGVAIHELGHAMGFISEVDYLDQNKGTSEANLFPTPLDFARHTVDSEAAGAVLDLTSDARFKYFSIDRGATAAIFTGTRQSHFARGVTVDEMQASHWMDNTNGDMVQIGIMDPFALPAGNINMVTSTDMLALDVIGWDLNMAAVPEPSTAIPLFVLFIALGIRRRQQRTAA